MKVGSLESEQELDVLRTLRNEKPNIQIRVDANGVYDLETALINMAHMEKLNIHSIEQPCASGDIDSLVKVSSEGRIPIALDESLIGVIDKKERDILLDRIKPHFIVLKPSLLGGIKSCEDWISRAKSRGIKWWITSALEGNEGLTGIAQWASSLKDLEGFQGLGTGSLYSNNTPAKTVVRDGNIWML
jgi:L-alanine-DL-glutamate epimerase-like enolase superfamily enzyme